MAIDLGSVALAVTPDMKQFAPQLDRGVRDSMKRVGGSMQKVGTIATAALTIPIIAGFSKMAAAASDLGESVNAVNVVFGEAAAKVHSFAESAAKDAGLSKAAFNQLVTPIGAMLQNVGFGADEAADASINLTQRAADMASVFNVDVSEALGAIQAGLRGEADPLEKFGVGLSDAAVTAHGLAMGLAGADGQLDANAKSQARLSLLMQQTDKIAGDFANTSDQVANAERIAAAEAENLAAQFGEKLLPVKARAIQLASGLLDRFNALSPAGQSLAMAIAGITAAVGPLLVVVGSLIKSLTVLGPVLAVLTGPVGLIIAAVAALAAGLIYAYQHSETFRKVVDTAFTLARLSITSAMTQIQSVISTATAAIRWIWQRWGTDIMNFARATFDNIRLLIDGALRIIKGIIDLFLGVVTGDWRRAWEGIKNIFSGVWNTILAILSQALNAMRLAISVALDTVKSIWRRALSDVKTMVSGRLNDLVGFFRRLPGRIASAMGDIGSLLLDKGKALIGGFVEGIRDAIPGIGDAVGAAARAAQPSSATGPGPSAGTGRAYERAKRLAAGLPLRVTSTYRSPEHNRRVGGARNSLHMDRSNPASDWVGPTWALDEFAARLRRAGGWRELLWRVKNHAPGDNPHVHVADQGGVFKGPGFVWMGAGYETFASGLSAEKVGGGDGVGFGTLILEVNGETVGRALIPSMAPGMKEEIRRIEVSTQ